MKKINRYIFMQLLVGFLLIALGMTGIIWLSQSLRLIDWIVNKGVPVTLFVELTLLVLPNFVAIITPLALFVVCLFVYQRLLGDRELIVMKSAGMSPWQMVRPTMYLGLVLVLVGYALTLWLVPYSVGQFKELQFRIKNNLAHVAIQEGQFNLLPKGITVYVRVFKPSGEMKGVFVHDARDPEKRIIMVARDGAYMVNSDGAHIVLHKGRRTEYLRKGETLSSLDFENYTMTMDETFTSKARSVSEEELPLQTLITASPERAGSMARYREYKVEAFKRLTQPWYALVFAMVVLVPLLLGRYNRRGQNSSVYLAIILVILLQSLALGFQNLSNKNLWFLPFMGLNIILPLAVSTWMLKRGYLFKDKPVLLDFNQAHSKKKLKVLLVLGMVLISSATLANSTPVFISDTSMDKEAPVAFEADQVSYNEKEEEITATGNVVIEQKGSILYADKVIYNKKTDTMQAEGNVRLVRPDGVEMTADESSLTSDFKKAFWKEASFRLADGSTFKAKELDRSEEGNLTVLRRVFYTPCTYCEGKESPLWNISAAEVEHNYKEQEFIYRHAVLDFKDIPVFYWPYLEYPDFQVKRKTGFLFPGFGSSSEMGFGVEVPFFWAISDSQDLYLKPTISVEHAPLIQGVYRGIYDKSALNIEFSGTYNNTGNPEDEKSTQRSRDGHIKADYEYDFNNKWRFKGSYFHTTDDTYFRRYPIDNVDDSQPWIQSSASLDYFGEQSYAYARVYGFQNLRNYVSNNEMPVVPQLNYQYTTIPFWNGLYTVSKLNAAGVYADQKPNSTRASYLQDFYLPYISDWGAVFDTQAFVRFDQYAVNYADDTSSNISRFYPNVSVKAHYPLIKTGKDYSHIFEPIIMGVWSPYGHEDKKIPDKDSLNLELDDTNLFVPNRYAGYDRVEKGSRINYGLQWTTYGPSSMVMSALLGQSYRLRSDDSAENQEGFEHDFSSYVGHLNLHFPIFGFDYRFRLSERDLRKEMTEFSTYLGDDPLKLYVRYLYLKASNEMLTRNNETEKNREEIYTKLSSKVTRHWSVFGFYNYDLTKGGGPIQAGGGVGYENECIKIDFIGDREFTKDEDYEGDTSFMVRLTLKTLGSL